MPIRTVELTLKLMLKKSGGIKKYGTKSKIPEDRSYLHAKILLSLLSLPLALQIQKHPPKLS